jgi:hypothetical protein
MGGPAKAPCLVRKALVHRLEESVAARLKGAKLRLDDKK